MRNHVASSLGADTPVPATTTEQPVAPVRKPVPPSQQALAMMGVTALPWVPVAAGAWIGDRYGSKGWGALAGFTVSFLILRQAAKDMAGNIT